MHTVTFIGIDNKNIKYIQMSKKKRNSNFCAQILYCISNSFKNFSTSFVTLFYLDSVNSNFCSEPTILIILLINEVCKITGVNENT